ncbi:hypothetical protein EB796_020864 [Bugula neritina]|uniref:Uncharacterized protein n=1 Tax=Bugula neritina TaxID=10212 RepID=A0A7J7J4M4_BUGNE|nr:hypothetical protein EB796_020864 [Bugula neritina]
MTTSTYNHYFSTTYDEGYNKVVPKVPEDAKALKRFHPRSFPGHQPEIDTAAAKAVYNDWNTTSTAAYQPYGFSAASPASVGNPATATEEKFETASETTPIKFLGAKASHPAPGGHVIAAPHSAPGTGAGHHQQSYKTTVGY